MPSAIGSPDRGEAARGRRDSAPVMGSVQPGVALEPGPVMPPCLGLVNAVCRIPLLWAVLTGQLLRVLPVPLSLPSKTTHKGRLPDTGQPGPLN